MNRDILFSVFRCMRILLTLSCSSCVSLHHTNYCTWEVESGVIFLLYYCVCYSSISMLLSELIGIPLEPVTLQNAC